MLSKKSMAETAKNKEEIPELLTLQEACDILKCHPNTLRQWDKKGILVAVRFGERKDRRYRKEDILKLLNQKKR
jgi:excisionase family DNA binding protein